MKERESVWIGKKRMNQIERMESGDEMGSECMGEWVKECMKDGGKGMKRK